MSEDSEDEGDKQEKQDDIFIVATNLIHSKGYTEATPRRKRSNHLTLDASSIQHKASQKHPFNLEHKSPLTASPQALNKLRLQSFKNLYNAVS